MLGRIAIVVALAGVLVVPSARTSSMAGFFVGFTEDLPRQIGSSAVDPAAELGAKAFRITLMWTSGQTQLTSADQEQLDRATAASQGMRVVLAVYADAGSKAPLDAAARDAYCGYVRNVLSRYASIRDVAIWNEPNKNMFWSLQDGAPAAYEALLARCYDVLHGAFAGVNVLGLLTSHSGNDNSVSTSPVTFIRGVGQAYRASGRTLPIFDTVGHHPYPLTDGERPWRKHIGNNTIAQGDWNKLMYNLWLAFGGTAQPIPGEQAVAIWYLEQGFQTTVDPAKAGSYTGSENVDVIPAFAGGEPESPPPAETSTAPDQATQFVDAVRLAACQPHVGALFNFLLADEPRLEGWQSGPLWVDLTPKPSYDAFARAIAEANASTVACETLKGGRPSGDFMPPTAPAAAMGAGETDPPRIVLSWLPSSDAASSVSYRISRNGNLFATTTETTWTDTAVTSGQSYTYVVRAVDSAGNLSDPDAPVTVFAPFPPPPPPPLPAPPPPPAGPPPPQPPPAPPPPPPAEPVPAPDVAPPSPPAAVRARVLHRRLRVVVSWSAATDDVGVAGYRVYRNGRLLASLWRRSLTDRTIARGRTYRYAVRPYDAAGNVGAAQAVTVRTPRR